MDKDCQKCKFMEVDWDKRKPICKHPNAGEDEGCPLKAKGKATTIDVYLHGSKDVIRCAGEEAGLTEKQLEKFRYACSEVKLTLYVDEYGHSKIVAVDGKKLVSK